MKNTVDNNKVKIAGEIASDFRFSHEAYGEKFYILDVAVKRLSEYVDYVPVVVSERMMDVNKSCVGSTVCVSGRFRSFNFHENGTSKLLLFVFAKEIEIFSEVQSEKTNHIFLDGYICKQPVYRKTPLGREITDFLIATNRDYNKSDYIPCISWGRNARYTSVLTPGTHIKITGRIQSRSYLKTYDDGFAEEKIAYEVSVTTIEVVDHENE